MNEIKYSELLPKDFNIKEVYGVVYCIINLINSKVYIGQTINLKNRLKQHRKPITSLDNLTYLQRAFLKHGIENFEIEIIDYALDKDQLDFLEILYIDKFNSRNSKYGYNIREGGKSAGHPSKETLTKCSKSLKGRIFSEEHKKNMSKSGRGRIFSEEHKRKLRKPKSEEHKKKIAKSKIGNIPWNKGKTGIYSQETLEKITKGATGRKQSIETILKRVNSIKRNKEII